MNIEQAERFYSAARRDPAIWARIDEAIASGKSPQQVAEAIAGIARSAGFALTAAESLGFYETKAKEQARRMQQVIAKAWADEEFHKRLLNKPGKALEDEGIDIPPGLEMRVVADTEKVRHLVLPPKPSTEELSEQVLGAVVGGGCIVANVGSKLTFRRQISFSTPAALA